MRGGSHRGRGRSLCPAHGKRRRLRVTVSAPEDKAKSTKTRGHMQKGESLTRRGHAQKEAKVTWPVEENKHKQNEVSRRHAKALR